MKKRFTAARLLRNYNFSRLRYLPLVALRIRNFGTYILDYGSLIAPGRRYVLRSGISIKTGQRIDTATIGTVFVSRDYGQIPDNIVIFDNRSKHWSIFSLCDRFIFLFKGLCIRAHAK